MPFFPIEYIWRLGANSRPCGVNNIFIFFCYMLFNSYTHVVEHGFQPYGHICVVSHLS
jgi:hypothetical protein